MERSNRYKEPLKAVGFERGSETGVGQRSSTMRKFRWLCAILLPLLVGCGAKQSDSEPARLWLSSTDIEFDSSQVLETSTKYITITNTANDPKTIISITSVYMDEVDDKRFSTDFDGTVNLGGGDTYTLGVVFNGDSTVDVDGSLYISHTGASGIEIVSLYAVGSTDLDADIAGSWSHTDQQLAPRISSIEFTKSELIDMVPLKITSMQFGPDGRLYAADMRGQINAYTIDRLGEGDYRVTATESINLIKTILNHDDDGTPNPGITNRLITGLLVTGSVQNPVLYVGSSDPRFGGGSAHTDTHLDTNSSVISRLTWDGSQWVKLDLVRGLPRSEENHSINGLALDDTMNYLYVAMGGNTNQGAPSQNFALLPEYALSAAILEIDLNMIGNSTYDLPTLDDETRPGITDSNDPFGGNDGKNQARLVSGGPVRVYAPGFRNPYDLELTNTGRLYTIDNGSNAGWGGEPHMGVNNVCTNAQSEPGSTQLDGLHLISGPGYYGGHPNPTRASQLNTFNTSNPQSAVDIENPIECEHLSPGIANGALTLFAHSTNGLAEYSASNFDGAMQGDLLTVSYDKKVRRIVLSGNGNSVVSNAPLFSNATAGTALEVIAQGDNEIFPGTIWVGDFTQKKIQIFEPSDYLNPGSGGVCIPTNSLFDSDQDSYSDQDELTNNTDPCNAGDVPPDADNDGLSDRLDTDDDNDGIPDVSDVFALDAHNGWATALPINYGWENDGAAAGYLFNMGFSGLMLNGNSDYLDQYDANNVTAGGAAGVFTIDAVPATDPYQGVNTQEYGFQLGVNVDATSEDFTVSTRVLAPFSGTVPARYRSMGLFIGTGDQDNYAKLVISSHGQSGGIQFAVERSGVFQNVASFADSMVGADYVDLNIHVSPALQTLSASYTVSTAGSSGPVQQLPTSSLPAGWLNNSSALAVGLISTSYRSTPFTVTWDYLRVSSDSSSPSGGSTSGTTTGGTTTGGTTTGGTTTSGTTTSGTTTSGTTTSGSSSVPVISSINGLVSVEIEHFDRLENTGARQWVTSNQSNASGDAAMVTTPDGGMLRASNVDSPAMHYDINFVEAGTYTVWLRGWGDTVNGEGRSDSAHVGLNGQLGSAAALQNFPSQWGWSREKRGGGTTTVVVPAAGTHTISVWMREDGLILDKLVLSLDDQFVPSGFGPDETLVLTGGSTTNGQGTTAGGSGITMPSSDNGMVSIEVESFVETTSTSTHQWVLQDQVGASGTAMVTTPNVGQLKNGTIGTPAMHYDVYFAEAGEYTVWLRGWGDTVNGEGRNDSAHVGLNGQLSTASALQNFPSSWTWSREKRSGGFTRIVVPSIGIHRVSIWMREDGLILDKLLLVKDGDYMPTGVGPDETFGSVP